VVPVGHERETIRTQTIERQQGDGGRCHRGGEGVEEETKSNKPVIGDRKVMLVGYVALAAVDCFNKRRRTFGYEFIAPSREHLTTRPFNYVRYGTVQVGELAVLELEEMVMDRQYERLLWKVVKEDEDR
jgi:hypothetical protein